MNVNEPNETSAVPPGQAGHTGAVEASAGGGTVALQVAQEALGTPTAITDEAQLRAALQNAPGKVLLDFTAKDCPACEDEESILKKLASECAGTTVLTVDVDVLPHVADALKADGTPTLYMGDGKDFLRDLERGSDALEREKRVPRPSHIREVEPSEKLMRKLKCARPVK